MVTGTKKEVLELDEKTYHQVVDGGGIVLVDCWAEGCGACSSFTPAYQQIAEQNPSHTFTKLDAGANRELVKTLGVTHLPTLLLYRDGVLLFQQAGVYNEKGLADIVSQAESVDMKMVRAEMAKMSSLGRAQTNSAPDS